MLDLTPGPYFAFVDPRYHLNSKQLIQRTRDLVGHFENNGIDRNRIVISIPSTEAGVRATWTLWNTDKINVNLTLVGGLAHATICAEAGAAYLSFDLASVSHTCFTFTASDPCAIAVEGVYDQGRRSPGFRADSSNRRLSELTQPQDKGNCVRPTGGEPGASFKLTINSWQFRPSMYKICQTCTSSASIQIKQADHKVLENRLLPIHRLHRMKHMPSHFIPWTLNMSSSPEMKAVRMENFSIPYPLPPVA